jgi:hypothetical protein
LARESKASPNGLPVHERAPHDASGAPLNACGANIASMQKPRLLTFETTGRGRSDGPPEQLLKHITKWQKGIEIGPWFAPLAPKREGYNCLSFDVFDTETLKKSAEDDPLLDNSGVSSIETVDTPVR